MATWIDPSLLSKMPLSLPDLLPEGETDPLSIRSANLKATEVSARSLPSDEAPVGPAYEVERRILGGVPCLTVKQESSLPAPVFIWFHGGGMVMGNAEDSIPRAVAIARAAGATVVIPEYRLAPEHPYPAAYDDCREVTEAVLLGALGAEANRSRVAVGGVSAGGNLAAAVALSVRGQHDLALVLLLCPMLDDRPSLHDYEELPVWNARLSRLAWSAYLGDVAAGSPSVPASAAPSRAEDLIGMAPLYLDVGSADPFLRESLEFASRSVTDGVPVEVHVFPGAFHVWDGFFPKERMAQEALLLRMAALNRALNP